MVGFILLVVAFLASLMSAVCVKLLNFKTDWKESETMNFKVLNAVGKRNKNITFVMCCVSAVLVGISYVVLV